MNKRPWIISTITHFCFFATNVAAPFACTYGTCRDRVSLKRAWRWSPCANNAARHASQLFLQRGNVHHVALQSQQLLDLDAFVALVRDLRISLAEPPDRVRQGHPSPPLENLFKLLCLLSSEPSEENGGAGGVVRQRLQTRRTDLLVTQERFQLSPESSHKQGVQQNGHMKAEVQQSSPSRGSH